MKDQQRYLRIVPTDEICARTISGATVGDVRKFQRWWDELQILALKQNFPLGAACEYQEYFDDGDDPDEVIADEVIRRVLKL